MTTNWPLRLAVTEKPGSPEKTDQVSPANNKMQSNTSHCSLQKDIRVKFSSKIKLTYQEYDTLSSQKKKKKSGTYLREKNLPCHTSSEMARGETSRTTHKAVMSSFEICFLFGFYYLVSSTVLITIIILVVGQQHTYIHISIYFVLF